MTSFKHWPIGRKLRFMNYILLINMLLVGGIGYWISHRMSGYLDSATHVEIPAVKAFSLIDMIHDGTMGLGYRALYFANSNDAEAKASIKEDLEKYTKEVNEYISTLENLNLDVESRDEIAKSKPLITAYMAAGRELIELSLSGKRAEAELRIPNFQKAFKNLEEGLDKAGTLMEGGADRLEKASAKFTSFANFIGFAILIQGLIVGLALPWFIFRSLLSTMDSTISHLSSEAADVRTSASSIRVSSENLSNATTIQASALQETASSIEEMNAMVKKSSDNASKSQDVSKQSHSASARGKEAVEHMMKAIEEINASNDTIMTQTEQSNRKISEIVKVIQEIGNKTKVINDIVFQTKLLSFNASVEAARAGEHGKGFAVVAEEVGNLAAMSGNAAKEISEMLDGSIKQVEAIIGETRRSIERLIAEGKEKVEAGTQVAKQCSNILDEVVNNVTHVDSMIQEIATASREQAQGIGEITRAMNQLDQVTHQNSSTSTQVASSSEQLARQSDQLMSVVTELKAFVYGQGSNAETTRQTSRAAFHPKAAERLTEMAQQIKPDSQTPSGEKANLKMEPLTTTPPKAAKKPVPGVSLTSMKMASSGAALDSIPSEDDSRFKDF